MEQQDAAPKKNSLFVGIDLGTSSSAIVDSNRKKFWVESYVGWPKDFIAAKVLRKPVLFGSEALKNRLSVDIFRPLEHGVLKEGSSKDGNRSRNSSAIWSRSSNRKKMCRSMP
jgi:rod shape-determining protein MreB